MKKMKFPKIIKKMNNTKEQQRQGNASTKMMDTPKAASFSQQLFGAFIIFMCLVWGYSIITEKKETPTIPLSQFATLVDEHQITSIVVEGDSLTGVKLDATKVLSKKEAGASVFSTLAAYGVSTTTLATTTITIVNDRGLSFWGSLIPIILPVVFLAIMIWWLGDVATV
jgi:hypothetical protein